MLTDEQRAYRTRQVQMAQTLPNIAWLKFYVPESEMPHFPRPDDPTLSKRDFHMKISKTKRRIRDMTSMIRRNMGLPPLNSQYQFPRIPAKLDTQTIEWRRRELKKTADLPDSVWLMTHHPTNVPRPPDVYGMYSSKRQFHDAVSLWRAAIKELVNRRKK